MNPNLKISSLNCHRTCLNNIILNNLFENQDIICLQEVLIPTKHNSEQQFTELIHKLEYHWRSKIYPSKLDNKNLILFIVKQDIEPYVTSFNELIPGRAIQLSIKNQHYAYDIINTYVPSGTQADHKEFHKKYYNEIKHLKNPILIGDWNFFENANMRNKSVFNYVQQSKANTWKPFTRKFIEIHKVFGAKLNYTFTVGNYKARLDRIYTLQENIQDFQKYNIIATHFSDHDKIIIELKWNQKQIKWGKGLWKLNTTILQHEEHKFETQQAARRYNINKEILNPAQNWDHFKKEIKSISIEIAKQISETNKDKLQLLKDNLQILSYNVENGDHTQYTYDKITRTKREIDKLEKQKFTGSQIRSKINKTLYDEKSTKYFFNKEKRNGQQCQIHQLINKDNDIINGKTQILHEAQSFYQQLYHQEETNPHKINDITSHIDNNLNIEQSNNLNQEITTQEIHLAIKDMENDKSPGDDGLPKEFYEENIQTLLPILKEVLNFTFQQNIQPLSQKNAIIKLIYKKNNPNFLKNWRPISLLNTDYKILTKILTQRLSAYMNQIIPHEQKCGVKGRQLHEIIRNLDSYRNQSDNGYFITIDQEKAFDRLNHKYIFTSLNKLGIQGHFLNTIQTIYTNITSQIIINGKQTQKIHIERGVRQGCPLSMSLFVIGTIPLINMIKENNKIQGHHTARNRKIKIQCYADDATIIIKHPKELETVYQTFKKYGEASGAKINKDKTEIFKLNSRSHTEPKSFQNKTCKQIKILGCLFCLNKKQETKLNLIKSHDVIDRLILNKHTNNSLMGKILNLNTYVLQTIWHKAWLINTKSADFQRFLRKLQSYLFEGNNKKEVYNKITKQISEGGLNLINVGERIESIKAKQILDSEYQLPETDNIIYNIGIKQKKIYGKTFTGPKKLTPNMEIKYIVDKLENKIKVLQNYKTRKKIITTKILHNILFSKENTNYHPELFIPIETKLKSNNYAMLHNVALFFPKHKCNLCKQNFDKQDHVLFHCTFTQQSRIQTQQWLAYFNIKFTESTIIEMTNITEQLPNYIISQYKYTMFTKKKEAHYKTVTAQSITDKLDKDIRFYIEYILPYINKTGKKERQKN